MSQGVTQPRIDGIATDKRETKRTASEVIAHSHRKTSTLIY